MDEDVTIFVKICMGGVKDGRWEMSRRISMQWMSMYRLCYNSCAR